MSKENRFVIQVDPLEIEDDAIYDNKELKLYECQSGTMSDICSLLNQQDQRIKELELLLKADKKIKTNSLNGFEKLRQENQQLEEKLNNFETCMKKYNVEDIEHLDLMLFVLSGETKYHLKEIKDKHKKELEQSQKQVAIEELEKLREYIVLNDEYDEEIGCNIIKTFDLIEDIRDRIEKLGGGENE